MTVTVKHLAAVVVKNCGDVLFGKGSSGVGDKEAGLSHGAIANYHTLDCLHDHTNLQNTHSQTGQVCHLASIRLLSIWVWGF